MKRFWLCGVVGLLVTNPPQGAAYNGVQVRKLPPKLAGEVDCSQSVNAGDIAGFVQAILAPNDYYTSAPACRIDNADTNNDGRINMDDMPAFVAALLS